MEENADGTTSMCMLEWLNKNNDTDHFSFYYGNRNNSWFPGVKENHANKSALFPKDDVLMELLTVAVLLPYFHNIVDKFDLNLRYLVVDKCAKCFKLRAEF